MCRILPIFLMFFTLAGCCGKQTRPDKRTRKIHILTPADTAAGERAIAARRQMKSLPQRSETERRELSRIAQAAAELEKAHMVLINRPAVGGDPAGIARAAYNITDKRAALRHLERSCRSLSLRPGNIDQVIDRMPERQRAKRIKDINRARRLVEGYDPEVKRCLAILLPR